MLRPWSRWRTQSRDRGLECQNVDVFPSSSEARCICSDQQVVQTSHRPGRGASDGDKKSLTSICRKYTQTCHPPFLPVMVHLLMLMRVRSIALDPWSSNVVEEFWRPS